MIWGFLETVLRAGKFPRDPGSGVAYHEPSAPCYTCDARANAVLDKPSQTDGEKSRGVRSADYPQQAAILHVCKVLTSPVCHSWHFCIFWGKKTQKISIFLSQYKVSCPISNTSPISSMQPLTIDAFSPGRVYWSPVSSWMLFEVGNSWE